MQKYIATSFWLIILFRGSFGLKWFTTSSNYVYGIHTLNNAIHTLIHMRMEGKNGRMET